MRQLELTCYVQGRPQEALDWVGMAEECPFYTSAELEYVINEAARMALAERRNISRTNVRRALIANPASLHSEDLEQHR